MPRHCHWRAPTFERIRVVVAGEQKRHKVRYMKHGMYYTTRMRRLHNINKKCFHSQSQVTPAFIYCLLYVIIFRANSLMPTHTHTHTDPIPESATISTAENSKFTDLQRRDSLYNFFSSRKYFAFSIYRTTRRLMLRKKSFNRRPRRCGAL